MKHILFILAFSMTAAAQELPRTRTVSYPSAELARAGALTPSRYFQPLHFDGNAATFKVPFEWADRRPFLHISSATRGYTVIVNDKVVGTQRAGMMATEFDLTDFAIEGVNTLIIKFLDADVLTPERVPALGEAYILAQPRVRIRDYVIAPMADNVELGVIVKSHLLNPKTVRVYYSLTNPDGSAGPYGHRDANFEMKLEDTVRFFVPLPDPLLWSHEAPFLYTLDLRLQHEGRFTEYVSYRVGLRDIAFRDGRLVVNGRPVTLTEENTLHLTEPAVDSVYRAADSLGLYVVGTADINTSRFGSSRARGGNPSNDPQWERDYRDRALGMYYTSQTHPSAAIFALANSGSSNGYNLYESYLALKAAEPTKPVIYNGGEWNSDKLSLCNQPVTRPQYEITHVRDITISDGKRQNHGAIFTLTNRRETAPLRNVTIDWRAGRTKGTVTLKGPIAPDTAHEFTVDYGAKAPTSTPVFNVVIQK